MKQDLMQTTREALERLQQDNALQRTYQKNPYVVLLGAAGGGYVIGGGLLTPFTRRVVKMSMRAVAIPLLATQVKAILQPQGSSDS